MTSEGTFPIGAKHQEPRNPFGLPGIQAAPLSHHVRLSGANQALSMPARNRASARALAVLNIELEIGPFPLEPNTRCVFGMLSTARPNCHILALSLATPDNTLTAFIRVVQLCRIN